jgi:plasmid stability protein
MSKTTIKRGRLAEVAAAYGVDEARAPHGKISISLPSELIDQVRSTAAESGLSVSAVIAAALRSTIASAEQTNLDAALEAQNDENLDWASAYLPIASRLWSGVEW